MQLSVNRTLAMTTATDNTRPYISYTKAFDMHITRAMEHKQVDVLVLTPQEYVGILEDKARQDPRLAAKLHAILAQSPLGQYWTQTASPNAGQPWVAPAALMVNDAYLIIKTLIALGIAGAGSFIKSTAQGTYIIIKGYPGLRRNLLQGTRYLASNPQMIQMGLGMRGLQNVAKGGFMLSIVVAAGIETLDFIFNDEKTMHDLVGGIGVEAVKAGLATMVGLGAGVMAGAVTAIAVAPLVTMAVAVLFAGTLLNQADQKHLIKQKVINALKNTTNEEIGIIKLK